MEQIETQEIVVKLDHSNLQVTDIHIRFAPGISVKLTII